MDKIRVYTDHTDRWYEEYTPEEYAQLVAEFNSDPLCVMLQDEINKEINQEIILRLGYRGSKQRYSVWRAEYNKKWKELGL